jgi:hypothetical protein
LALLSFTAFGRSSMMFDIEGALAVVPLSSTTVTANCSGRLLAPLAVGWASLWSRVAVTHHPGAALKPVMVSVLPSGVVTDCGKPAATPLVTTAIPPTVSVVTPSGSGW